MRHILLGLALTCLAALVSVPPALAQEGTPLGFVSKLGQDIDIRSGGRILADELSAGNVILPDLATPVAGVPAVPQIQLRGGNVQVNDPAQDYIQIFTGFRPFVHAVQSETSMAASGRNIVVTYNNSTGFHLIPNPSGPGLVVDRVQLSGFSSSTDGAARPGRAGSSRLPRVRPTLTAIHPSASIGTVSFTLPTSPPILLTARSR